MIITGVSKIKLGDKHYLNFDPYCYWITVEGKSKKGTPFERRISGYKRTFNEAVTSALEKKIKSLKSSEIENLETLRDHVNETIQEVLSWKADLPPK